MPHKPLSIMKGLNLVAIIIIVAVVWSVIAILTPPHKLVVHPTMATASICEHPEQSWFTQRVMHHPVLGIQQLVARHITGREPHWIEFDAVGPISALACDGHPMRVFGGDGDEAKRVCWNEDVFMRKDNACIVFSIGSNNQFAFEEDIIVNTTCSVHTFDCTVDNLTLGQVLQDAKAKRFVFHWICVGAGCGRTSLMQLIDAHGVPSYLKFDAEGAEYETLSSFMYEARYRLEQTGVNAFPPQIGLELHSITAQFEVSRKGLATFVDMLKRVGGYELAHRRDNILGYGGSELLFVRG